MTITNILLSIAVLGFAVYAVYYYIKKKKTNVLYKVINRHKY